MTTLPCKHASCSCGGGWAWPGALMHAGGGKAAAVLCGCQPQLQVAIGSDTKLQQNAVEMLHVAERRCGSAMALRTAGVYCSLPWMSCTLLDTLN
jgi:hypothetical protein